jgi:uncharacterized protein
MGSMTTQPQTTQTLRALVPLAVEEIVRTANPVRVILFGSVARGDEEPDSDLDFLVVMDQVGPGQARRRWMSEIRRAITVDASVDVFVTDPEECSRRRDVPGSIHYWPMREGKVVYDRSA